MIHIQTTKFYNYSYIYKRGFAIQIIYTVTLDVSSSKILRSTSSMTMRTARSIISSAVFRKYASSRDKESYRQESWLVFPDHSKTRPKIFWISRYPYHISVPNAPTTPQKNPMGARNDIWPTLDQQHEKNRITSTKAMYLR